MGITRSSGKASTVFPRNPVIVVAAKSELTIASSVASMAARKSGLVASLCRHCVVNTLAGGIVRYTVGSGRGKRDDKIPAAVGGDSARATEAEKRTTREAHQIAMVERRVGRDDDHA